MQSGRTCRDSTLQTSQAASAVVNSGEHMSLFQALEHLLFRVQPDGVATDKALGQGGDWHASRDPLMVHCMEVARLQLAQQTTLPEESWVSCKTAMGCHA